LKEVEHVKLGHQTSNFRQNLSLRKARQHPGKDATSEEERRRNENVEVVRQAGISVRSTGL